MARTNIGYKPIAYRVDHTSNHVNWSGRKQINGLRPEQPVFIDGELYYRQSTKDKFWTSLGYAPRPITDLDKFKFDFYNGMIMKYGFINSLCFALRWYYKRKKMKWQS